ncbi:MAG: glycosyl transferase [Methylotenera sp.]|nr:MAG: glycosyl transferase [Methylotenera sp.]
MLTVAQALFLIILVLLAIPVTVLTLQIVFSLLPYRARVLSKQSHATIAVLIPAHNEQQGIVATLESVQKQLKAGDRMIVIADNCTDQTAEVAWEHGAIAIERHDAVKRGKGYALDFGMRYLENQAPPDVVIIVDADCLLADNALATITQKAIEKNRPVQALYLMRSPAGASLKTKIAEFAWTVKNWTRALGPHQLSLPCQLMGTGMAFPWALLQKANLASGHIVEDLKLGLDFAEQHRAPVFCPEALVTSVFPLNNEGVKSQRTRWEHGHLGMIATEGPALLFKSLLTFNGSLLVLVLDMCVPPLALLVLMALVLAVIAAVAIAITGLWLPWLFAIGLLLALGFAVLAAWAKFGKHILSLSSLAYAPLYMLAKIPLYMRFLVKRQVEWVRSKRD